MVHKPDNLECLESITNIIFYINILINSLIRQSGQIQSFFVLIQLWMTDYRKLTVLL